MFEPDHGRLIRFKAFSQLPLQIVNIYHLMLSGEKPALSHRYCERGLLNGTCYGHQFIEVHCKIQNERRDDLGKKQ